MSAVLAQRNYDRELPVDLVAEDWEPLQRVELTDDDVEQFIFNIADTGKYDDMLGRDVRAPSLYLAIAMEYRRDKAAIPSAISGAFFAWARSAAYIAAHGKPITIPPILQKQAGMK